MKFSLEGKLFRWHVANRKIIKTYPLQISLEMKSQFSILFALALAVVSFAHDGHHEEQIPMNYVKYPYQAMYPGDNEGIQ